MIKKLNVLGIILTALALSACNATTKGTYYKETPVAKIGQAQIVFYSNPKKNAWVGAAKIMDNDTEVGTLINGQFFIYDAAPGKHKIWGNSSLIDTPEEITVEAGKTYYYRYISKYIPYASRTWLKVVDEETAKTELAECCKDGIESK